MSYPKNIVLTKTGILENALYTTSYNHPIGMEVGGYMWEHSLPKVDEDFFVWWGKLIPAFKTSTVKEIIEETKDKIKFKTENSIYEILIRDTKERVINYIKE